MRVLLGYGALRDAEATNRSVMSYVRLVYHAPRAETSRPEEVEEVEEVAEVEEVEVVEWLPAWPLPAGAWRPVRLEVVEGRLSLWLDSAPLLRNISLPGWAPATGWRAGVHGSREGPYDTQWVDNLQLSSGALRSAAEVGASTTRNHGHTTYYLLLGAWARASRLY